MAKKDRTEPSGKSDKTTAGVQYDPTIVEELWQQGQQLVSDHTNRMDMLKGMTTMYLMQPEEVVGGPADTTKLTLSPDPSNQVTGAARLMSAAEPVPTMPADENDSEAKQASSKMEKMAKVMWRASGRLGGAPLQNDCTLSALLFAETHIAVLETRHLIARAGDDAAKRKRAEMAVAMTPILYEVWSPLQGYPTFDRLGLAGYYRRYTEKAGVMQDEWYGLGHAALMARKRNETVVVREWWDPKYWVVGIEGDAEPIYFEQHDKGWVQIVAQITEGSGLFEKVEERQRPFLYNMYASKLWYRQNLALTGLYTNVAGVALNAMFVHQAPPGKPEKSAQVDFSKPGGVVELEPGERFEPMSIKGAIDPAVIQALEIAERKGEESTIYRQALGEPIGSNAPYSMVALLHQAGRLPLVNPSKLVGWAIASAHECAFRLIKEAGTQAKARYMADSVEIAPSEIPGDFHFDCKLDVTLPQERLQLATLGQSLITAGLASRGYIREQLLNIGQSDEMDEEVWTEQAAEALVLAAIQAMVAPPAPPTPPVVPTTPRGGGATMPETAAEEDAMVRRMAAGSTEQGGGERVEPGLPETGIIPPPGVPGGA